MRAFLLFFLLFISKINAYDYKKCYEVELKKDEKKSFIIKYEDKTKDFNFRWTLYKNGGLVVHRYFNRYVAQHMLYLREKNRSFKVELISRGQNYYDLPFLMVKFKEFREKRAVFKVMLFDAKEQVVLENGDKKEWVKCKE